MTRHEMNFTRRAPVAVSNSTWDEESRTFDAVISTGADVQRRDAHGVYVERLDLDAIDPDSLIDLPVMTDHARAALSTVGKVIAARREAEGLAVTVQMSSAADVAPVRERIADGTLAALSIGYQVSKWKASKENGTRVLTATAWRVSEVSIVAIPADPGAKVRGQEMDEETEVIENENVESRSTRRTAIRGIARAAGMTAEAADELIDSGADETTARAAAFDFMQQQRQAGPIIRVMASHDAPEAVRTRRADALFARVSGETPNEAARPYMAESLRDMARGCLEAAGVATRGLDADSLFRAAMHTTSDFPELLTGTGNRVLMGTYQAATSPLKAIARQTTLPDFRAASKLKLSDVGLLEKVSESGEITRTTRGETSESYALDTYGSMFALSRKALINDDLGAFRDWGQTAGHMAAQTEANLLWALLDSNPVMNEDGTPLFHADHGNLEAAATVTYATVLSNARKALRGMKGLDGVTPINVVPKYLLVGPSQETWAEQILAELYPAETENVNPFSGKLLLLVDPRITDDRWYVFADPASMPVLEYAYLTSAPGPQMASRPGWDVLGMEFRIHLDFGAGVIDWRGAFLNETP